MNDITVASTEADADAVRAVEQHHAELSGALHAAVESLVRAVGQGDASAAAAARADVVSWARRELLPHAAAEEETMYPAAHEVGDARLLIEAMLEEHRTLAALVDDIERGTDGVGVVSSAGALRTVFDIHVAKENNLVMPLLASSPSVSLADLLSSMHERLTAEQAAHEAAHAAQGGHACGCGGHDAAHAAQDEHACGCGGHDAAHAAQHEHTCTCGEHDAEGFPELDARTVPHSIRHATVIGALDTVRPGDGLVLVAPHDPLPLLAQIERRSPGVFEVEYLQRGPEAWRISFVRKVGAGVGA